MADGAYERRAGREAELARFKRMLREEAAKRIKKCAQESCSIDKPKGKE